MSDNTSVDYKVSWKGWLSLIILIISFSGIFAKDPGPLRALDFQVLTGEFGQVAKGIIFTGKGGVGAREGFMFALTLFPTLMFALAASMSQNQWVPCGRPKKCSARSCCRLWESLAPPAWHLSAVLPVPTLEQS